MSVLTKLQKRTAKFLDQFGVSSAQVDYINDDYILKLLNAQQPRAAAMQKAEKQMTGKEIKKPSSTEGLLTAQWSGYISYVSVTGDKLYFGTPCQAPQYYWIDRTQLVSISQVGTCGNYALFYAVINY